MPSFLDTSAGFLYSADNTFSHTMFNGDMMPAAAQILDELTTITNAYTTVAVFWHVYFAAIAGLLLSGLRPSRRVMGMLLALPLLSVCVIAWAAGNPFNGAVFAVVGALVLYLSARLPKEPVRAAPPQIMITGVIVFFFGWLYPHFLETESSLAYVYAAPTGLIPCPTLSIVTGLALMLSGLRSRALAFVLGAAGLFYGATGMFRLGVALDVILLLGAVSIVMQGIQLDPAAPRRSNP